MVGKSNWVQQPGIPDKYRFVRYGKDTWDTIEYNWGCGWKTICKLVLVNGLHTTHYHLVPFKGMEISKANYAALQPWVDELNA